MRARPFVLAALTLVCAPLAVAGQSADAQAPQSSSQQDQAPVSSPPVVVTASKREEELINSPSTMTVITEDAIRATPSPSFVELMRVVPGVNVTQISARDVNITSRAPTGSLENSTLVLLDGRSIYQDFFGFVMWDFIPVDASQIEQIEVIHGPASAVWGSNALTGVVNVITKSPREMAGKSGSSNLVSIQFGQFDRTPTDASFDGGGLFSINVTHAQAPTDRFAFKISGGMLSQEAFVRPTGTIDNADHTPYPAFQNRGTRQPKLDARVDYDFPDKRRTLILAGGIAGTDGIIYTGLGPLDVQSGSTFKYGRVAFHRDEFRLQAFVNSLNGEGPLMLQVDRQGNTTTQTFDNQAYDVELSNAHVHKKHVLSYGGNFRNNRFDLSLAPDGDHRAEGGIYVQEDLFLSDRIRWIAGTRVDWFGVLDKTVFSPRTTLLVKPRPRDTIRFSFNRAFRAPALLNNFIDFDFFVPTDSGLRVPAVATGNLDLKEESLTAYEAAYSGGFGPMTLTAAVFLNDARDQIYFTVPAGGAETLPLQFTYVNIGRVVSRGIELSMEGRLNRAITGFVNYTWQGVPDTDVDLRELNIPPRYHVNAGASYNQSRYFGTTSVTYQAEAYWQDVLGPSYHGWTKPYTMVNASAGVRSVDESMTVAMRVTNLLNRSIQQHVFGDVIRRAVIGEVRFAF